MSKTTMQAASVPATGDEAVVRPRAWQRGGTPQLTARALVRAALGPAEGTAPDEVAARDAAHRRLLMLADAVAAGLALLVVGTLFGPDLLRPASLAVLVAVMFASRVMSLHERDQLVLSKTTLNEAPSLFHLATFSTLVVFLGESVFLRGELGLGGGITLWAAFLSTSVLCRSAVRRASVRRATAERCLVIGDAQSAGEIGDRLAADVTSNAHVVAQIQPAQLSGPEDAEALRHVVREARVQRVILDAPDLGSSRMMVIVREAKALGVKVTVKPRLLDVVGTAVEFDDVRGSVFLGVRRFGLTGADRRAKRAVDLLGASLALLAALPLLLLIAGAIRLDSRGPVFFRQVRVGRDGRPFHIWKFRTMVPDAEALKAELREQNECEDGLFKIEDDPRITRVGRLLRCTSLDELPQLFNVLVGEMSLVGPRPLVVEEDERIFGWHRERLQLTPGMTGIWQVLGSARVPLSEMVALDYMYIVNWSIWKDVQILLRTIPFVLSRRGL